MPALRSGMDFSSKPKVLSLSDVPSPISDGNDIWTSANSTCSTPDFRLKAHRAGSPAGFPGASPRHASPGRSRSPFARAAHRRRSREADISPPNSPSGSPTRRRLKQQLKRRSLSPSVSDAMNDFSNEFGDFLDQNFIEILYVPNFMHIIPK